MNDLNTASVTLLYLYLVKYLYNEYMSYKVLNINLCLHTYFCKSKIKQKSHKILNKINAFLKYSTSRTEINIKVK